MVWNSGLDNAFKTRRNPLADFFFEPEKLVIGEMDETRIQRRTFSKLIFTPFNLLFLFRFNRAIFPTTDLYSPLQDRPFIPRDLQLHSIFSYPKPQQALGSGRSLGEAIAPKRRVEWARVADLDRLFQFQLV